MEKELDLEAWKFFLRDQAFGAGAQALEKLLEGVGCGRRTQPLACPRFGAAMHSVGQRTKVLRTIPGAVP